MSIISMNNKNDKFFKYQRIDWSNTSSEKDNQVSISFTNKYWEQKSMIIFLHSYFSKYLTAFCDFMKYIPPEPALQTKQKSFKIDCKLHSDLVRLLCIVDWQWTISEHFNVFFHQKSSPLLTTLTHSAAGVWQQITST